MTNPPLPPIESLNLLGSSACPVCQHPFSTPDDTRVPGVRCEVTHPDEDCIAHLEGHTPRELAIALLATDARYVLVENLFPSSPERRREFTDAVDALAVRLKLVRP